MGVDIEDAGVGEGSKVGSVDVSGGGNVDVDKGVLGEALKLGEDAGNGKCVGEGSVIGNDDVSGGGTVDVGEGVRGDSDKGGNADGYVGDGTLSSISRCGGDNGITASSSLT